MHSTLCHAQPGIEKAFMLPDHSTSVVSAFLPKYIVEYLLSHNSLQAFAFNKITYFTKLFVPRNDDLGNHVLTLNVSTHLFIICFVVSTINSAILFSYRFH